MHGRHRHAGTLLAGSILVGGLAGLSVAFAMAIAMDPTADLLARDARIAALGRKLEDAERQIGHLSADRLAATARIASLDRTIDDRLDGLAEVVDESLARETRERRGDDERLAGLAVVTEARIDAAYDAVEARVDALAKRIDALARRPAPAPVVRREVVERVVERIVVRHEYIPVYPIYTWPCR